MTILDEKPRDTSNVTHSYHWFKQLKNKGRITIRQFRRIMQMIRVINEGFVLAYREGAFSQPNQPEHTRLVRYFCRRLCETLDIEVTRHGPMPTEHALWVSNHISWLDIPVVGSQTRLFFLAKAEIQNWPLFGRLAQAGGTLFIKRGSGDSAVVKAHMSGFLKQKIPVLFFPEATTTDGRSIKRLHGKLLAAAIATQTFIQPVVICYINVEGKLDQVVPFVDDQGFVENLLNVLALEKIRAHVMPLAAISTEGHTVESLTQLLYARMCEGLQVLQQRVFV
ncbi:lysophospholipid acyltransferase family protein [Alkanindiges sp. WGS2144]|uniref:lysophospholipid acyltransferase family protein n=1 Tax=Alkanindiges sp. WGS2144 TaxID=3366808 RepID=UPI00375218CE